MKWSKLKTLQSFVLISAIILEPLFIKLIGIKNTITALPWYYQLSLEVFILLGIMQIISIPIYFILRRISPSIFPLARQQ